jgi:hypothetical protein
MALLRASGRPSLETERETKHHSKQLQVNRTDGTICGLVREEIKRGHRKMSRSSNQPDAGYTISLLAKTYAHYL